MNILVIEDDILHSTDIVIKLSKLGFDKVTLVQKVQQIKQTITGQQFDMVFCDLSLPETDGIDLLCNHLAPEMIKGVVITTAAVEDVIELTQGMCIQLGYMFVASMTKPFSLQQIAGVVESFECVRDKQLTESLIEPLSNENEVIDALENDRVSVVFQPQYNFHTGRLYGLEALARLQSAKGKLINPSCFLPVIKKMALDQKLYLVVLNKAISEISRLNSQIQLSININPILLESDLCNLTLTVCEKHQFPIDRLTLEITEEAAYNVTSQALANLARLRLNGAKLSIDDFGTGYASLEQLVDLPFSELKIDRVFISAVKDNYRLQQLTQTMLHMAQSLNMTCVAEGVEDDQTWQYLKEIGVDVCQGFYTGKPMSIEDYSRVFYLNNQIDLSLNSVIRSILVVVDENLTRGKALAKALNNQLCSYEVQNVSDTNQLKKLISVTPVEFAIVSESLFSKDLIYYLSGEESKIILLYDKLVYFTDNSITSLKRQMLVSDTARLILQNVDNLLNAKSKNTISRLSYRELQVARLLVAGFTNKHISFELGINQKTVSTYKSRVLEKLGVKTTLDLAEFLRENK
ncbi:EAL domain-containing protein [Shewanella sp. MBTL60-007]|uniref:EAL domain-containing protein n=1 Tax=Shewanella sp. MBTL60-007 TaxID=2815911 RepID=UPI001BB85523|nr:EAL domain-containing protein [Shewanella sp. MBTL60-007]GIU32104.1 diguanylate phosphodiesterase [Shewanella sp. MBTL60-007]